MTGRSQWYTKPDTADFLWECVCDDQRAQGLDAKQARILEPTAGQGSLIRPALRHPGVSVTAVEEDFDNVLALRRLATRPDQLTVVCDDFMRWSARAAMARNYHFALMNPPYEDGQDREHIIRTFSMVPLGCVYGVFSSAVLDGYDRRSELWEYLRVRFGVRLGRERFDHPPGVVKKATSPTKDYVLLGLERRPAGEGSEAWHAEQWRWRRAP